MTMTGTNRAHQHAIVLRAKMAGFLAARIFGDRVGRVTPIERVGIEDRPEAGKGLPCLSKSVSTGAGFVLCGRSRSRVSEIIYFNF